MPYRYTNNNNNFKYHIILKSLYSCSFCSGRGWKTINSGTDEEKIVKCKFCNSKGIPPIPYSELILQCL